jgi:hypothetical protein
VVEDTQEQVHRVTFYYFNADLNDLSWLKPGTIALIKEPQMQYGTPETKVPFIRVDSPSGFIKK